MQYLFYMDEFELYGGKVTPVRMECKVEHGCIATYKMEINFHQCGAKVFVSEKGIRKVFTLYDLDQEAGGKYAVFDCFESRMRQDGDVMNAPKYIQSTVFKRRMAKTFWRACSVICMLVGVMITAVTMFRGSIGGYTVAAAFMILLGLAAYFNTYRIEDLFPGKSNDYMILKEE